MIVTGTSLCYGQSDRRPDAPKHVSATLPGKRHASDHDTPGSWSVCGAARNRRLCSIIGIRSVPGYQHHARAGAVFRGALQSERQGITPQSKAMTPDQQRIGVSPVISTGPNFGIAHVCLIFVRDQKSVTRFADFSKVSIRVKNEYPNRTLRRRKFSVAAFCFCFEYLTIALVSAFPDVGRLCSK